MQIQARQSQGFFSTKHGKFIGILLCGLVVSGVWVQFSDDPTSQLTILPSLLSSDISAAVGDSIGLSSSIASSGTREKITTETASSASDTTTSPPVDPLSCPQVPVKFQEISDPNVNISPKNETHRFTITKPPFWISLHEKTYDRMRWNSIMVKGEYYETGITAWFNEILSSFPTSTQDGKSPLVVDIGMNIGWYTLYSRSFGFNVAAFDANPVTFFRVCESVQLNQWDEDSSISLWPYGLGTSEGTLNFTVARNPGASSFLSEKVVRKVTTFPVRVVPLDLVAQQENWFQRTIPLVKIDVEGYEEFVFRGATQFLSKANIHNILMETSGKDDTRVWTMLDFIYEAGFEVHQLGNAASGQKYMPEWWPKVNAALQERNAAQKEERTTGDVMEDESIKVFTATPCNIWWKRRASL